MGTWSLPKTNNEFENLMGLLRNPLEAREAEDKLYNLLGDDSLFDNIIKAKKVDERADVRSLVSNRIWQIYYTGQPSTDIVHEPLTGGVMNFISEAIKDEFIFNRITTVKDVEEARRKVMWALDANPDDAESYIATRESNGMDYLVMHNERCFRLEAISGVVCEIDQTNQDLYGFEKQLSISF